MLFCVFAAAGNEIFEHYITVHYPNASWLDTNFKAGFNVVTNALSTLCLAILNFQNMVPISLMITVEVIKTIQSWLIFSDLGLYYDKQDSPATPRNWNISDDLGQISFIFSDKTGTLTQNVMEFRQCSTGDGNIYGVAQLRNLLPNKEHPEYERVHKLMLSISLCHSVLVQREGDEFQYKSQSPDEGALILAAKEVGYVLTEQGYDDLLTLEIFGANFKYELLHVIEFSSDRKRMSTIIRTEKGEILVLTKGADSVIFKLLHEGQDDLVDQLNTDLEIYSEYGLRTLCYAMSTLTESEYQSWLQQHTAANLCINDRDEELERVAKLVERELTLLGATAIEDRLQDGVPEAIKLFLDAGIKVWVLTGDKTETAINIGYSCNVLPKTSTLLIIRGATASDDQGSTIIQIETALKVVNETRAMGSQEEFALVIDGNGLIYALDRGEKQRMMFLELALHCAAVMCCRVSPKQKAKVVLLVKDNQSAITLAIGDGANDVSMIQAAHIGVGISGEEGLQASMAADYAIGQFRFLVRLLLVEGRWCYTRTAAMISNFFYKNVVYNVPLLCYQFYSGYSAGTAFDLTFMIFVNTLFTGLPVGIMGAFDKDVEDKIALAMPQLYAIGIKGEALTWKSFLLHTLEACFHACVIYFVTIYSFTDLLLGPTGQLADFTILSIALLINTMVVMNVGILHCTNDWSFLPIAAQAVSLSILVMYAFIYSAVPGVFGTNIAGYMFATPVFWLTMGVIITLCILPRMTAVYVFRTLWPTDTQIAQEMQSMVKCNQYKAVVPEPLGSGDGVERMQTEVPRFVESANSPYFITNARQAASPLISQSIAELKDGNSPRHSRAAPRSMTAPSSHRASIINHSIHVLNNSAGKLPEISRNNTTRHTPITTLEISDVHQSKGDAFSLPDATERYQLSPLENKRYRDFHSNPGTPAPARRVTEFLDAKKIKTDAEKVKRHSSHDDDVI